MWVRRRTLIQGTVVFAGVWVLLWLVVLPLALSALPPSPTTRFLATLVRTPHTRAALAAATRTAQHPAFLLVPHAYATGAPLTMPNPSGPGFVIVHAANMSTVAAVDDALARCAARPDCTGVWGTGVFVGAEDLDLAAMPAAARSAVHIPAALSTTKRTFPFFLRRDSVHTPAVLDRYAAACALLTAAPAHPSPLSADPPAAVARATYAAIEHDPDTHLTEAEILAKLTPLDTAAHAAAVRRVAARAAAPPPRPPATVLGITLTIFNRPDQLAAWADALAATLASWKPPPGLRIAVCAAHYGGAGAAELPFFAPGGHAAVLDLPPPFSRAGGMQACFDHFVRTYADGSASAVALDALTVMHSDVDVHISPAYLRTAATVPIPGMAFVAPVSDFDPQLFQSYGLIAVAASDVVAAGGYRPEDHPGYNCEDTDLVHRLAVGNGLIPLRHTVPRMYHVPHARVGEWYTGKLAKKHTACGDLAIDVTLRTISSSLLALCLAAAR